MIYFLHEKAGFMPVIFYYFSCQGDTSVVVLIVLCFGLEFLGCLHIMYVFIF